jgi:3-oxoacyl-[acyl-carrier-protein] synthase III
MHIRTIQHAVPTHKVTNDDILETFRHESRDRVGRVQMALLETQVRATLATAGTEVRYKLAPGEKALDLVLDAGRRALADATMAPGDVDFLIYTGVARGWLEPATANVVQSELGMPNATCFDMLDACASWLRAMQVARSLIQNGTYKTGMIVNCESSLVRSFWASEIKDSADLKHRVAQFTIGEAATATIITDAQPDDDFYFKFQNFGEHYKLCMIPLANIADFSPGDPDPRHATSQFFSLSRELVVTTVKKIAEVYGRDPHFSDRCYDIAFGHEASQKASEVLVKHIGLQKGVYYSIHPRYGNCVSASVPLGMSLAQQEGRLNRGDKTLIVVGSAGVSVGLATFTF